MVQIHTPENRSNECSPVAVDEKNAIRQKWKKEMKAAIGPFKKTEETAKSKR